MTMQIQFGKLSLNLNLSLKFNANRRCIRLGATGIIIGLWMIAINVTTGQAHVQSTTYQWPTDTLVLQKLHKWQGEKFGLLMHWGTYSEWGIVESWSLCPEDEGWTKRTGPYANDYFTYKKAYENLQTKFNPVQFNPDKWAKAAKEAGMKYVVFTTKHHDGFCMFDTHQTDYKITSSKTPFSKNAKSNIAKEIFKSFRSQGFMIGAYFSKPDWHSPDYWWPYFPPKDRNVNYDPTKYPKKWTAFKDYTYAQIKELMTEYGRMDILWLDGGWVRPHTKVEQEKTGVYNQDIDMPRIAAMARKHQPGLLVVDRSVAGKYENYQTPEQTVPTEPLDHPWESCITMGNSWSYVPGDHYKSTNTLIHLLVRIVSRGGNLLLNIGPSPLGDWSDTAYQRLAEIGAWMQINGTSIYDSKPLAPYGQGNLVYTASEDGKSKYVFLLSGDSTDQVSLPDHLQLPAGLLEGRHEISVLGYPDIKVQTDVKSGLLKFSKKSINTMQGKTKYALVIKLTGREK